MQSSYSSIVEILVAKLLSAKAPLFREISTEADAQ
jgi:hypothetical protein